MAQKYVYLFADGKAEGTGKMKDLLGGKGAGLAEMTNAGLPVPPGFTITTEACNAYYAAGEKFPDGMWDEVTAALQRVEQTTGKKFGGSDNPLLVSVRSGAKFSMPGMMDTVLNLGLNEQTLQALAQLTGNERFAYDAYRRFIQMFGKIVLGINPERFEHRFNEQKQRLGVTEDTQVDAAALRQLCAEFKEIVREETKKPFPDDPLTQLELAIRAVFASWNGKRAKDYRRTYKIPDDLGTAVNVVTMVFGNLGEDSGTGVAFTRNASTGERELYGEYLQNAQGEDVVAGIRTPKKIAQLQSEMPEIYHQFVEVAERLERHYKDVQDLEFTIERGKLYMLQTRNGKRTGPAAVKIAVDMVEEGLIDKQTAVERVEPAQLDQLLHPMIDPKAQVEVIATGLPASPGAATGKVVFDPEEAEQLGRSGEKVILVRTETSPEDFHGMVEAQAILTSRGGMTCVAGDTRILTDRGMLTAEAAFGLLDKGETLRILSFDSHTLRPVWRTIIAAGRKPSEVITVAVSQTGHAEHNLLRLTADHKMFTIQHRQLTKKRLDAVLADGDFLTVVGEIPALGETTTSPDLAYVADVNFMGRVREGIKRNIMFDGEKLRRDVLPLCAGETHEEVEALLDSPLRSYRVKQVGDPEPAMVYNFEVGATEELDKNFVVFSSRLTPVLVSNSHAAVVARGMGKCCVAGCGDVVIDYSAQQFTANGHVIKKGEAITLDGSTGRVILGEAPLIEPEISGHFKKLMEWVNEFRKLGVRANADTPHDAEVARGFGAEGIGLCRTEHMFFEGDRIDSVRQMILASGEFKNLETQLAAAEAEVEKASGEKKAVAKKRASELRRRIKRPQELYTGALAALLELQREDFVGIFRAMNGFPVTIRTLDPPLHEFLPHDDQTLKELARKIKLPFKEARARVHGLHEFNPMLGHRGCRLGIVYPEITEMQARAIFEAAVKVRREGIDVKPEIMIPLVANINELKMQADVVRRVASEVMQREGVTIDYLVGTMIELPRAALTANRIAEVAEFFSFGTNDLTQTTMGLSRDDAGRFLPFYVEKKIFPDDPFQTLDQEGVGQLIEMGVKRGRATRSGLKVGICGEHGGDPESVVFCHRAGLNYVSCSPYRVPIALLAAAQAALADESGASAVAKSTV
jgi:phosphoenolpyruvate synthase/pyruvate phosphate dikinase